MDIEGWCVWFKLDEYGNLVGSWLGIELGGTGGLFDELPTPIGILCVLWAPCVLQ
jgi:hypothetical protein